MKNEEIEKELLEFFGSDTPVVNEDQLQGLKAYQAKKNRKPLLVMNVKLWHAVAACLVVAFGVWFLMPRKSVTVESIVYKEIDRIHVDTIFQEVEVPVVQTKWVKVYVEKEEEDLTKSYLSASRQEEAFKSKGRSLAEMPEVEALMNTLND